MSGTRIWLAILFAAGCSMTLTPDEMRATEISLKFKEKKQIAFELLQLELGSRYELRVSWPATSPISVNFSLDDAVDISAEKVVFIPKNETLSVLLEFTGIGVTRNYDFIYNVPLHFSLDKQYLGLTRHIWEAIAYLLPILVLSISVVLIFFPSSISDSEINVKTE
jgi:hypothetical protein